VCVCMVCMVCGVGDVGVGVCVLPHVQSVCVFVCVFVYVCWYINVRCGDCGVDGWVCRVCMVHGDGGDGGVDVYVLLCVQGVYINIDRGDGGVDVYVYVCMCVQGA